MDDMNDFIHGPSNMNCVFDDTMDIVSAVDFHHENFPSLHIIDDVADAIEDTDEFLVPLLTDGENNHCERRLSSKMPLDDGYVALGVIRLYHKTDARCIRGRTHDDPYPNVLIENGLNKKQLKLDGLSIGTRSGVTSIRVYILPEDVDRSNRGNVKDFHKLVKYLLEFVDRSTEAWLGHSDPLGPFHPYQQPVHATEESLFYTFNTLYSPSPNGDMFEGSAYSWQAMNDALEGSITGLKTALYPYQKRSIAVMVQKEAGPAKIKDPRKTKTLDIYGNTFYLDLNNGALFRHRPLYSEPRGGILAETMGYGKTLICLALILATKGHYPVIPHHCIEANPVKTYPSTPSLLSMAARRMKYEGQPWKNDFYLLKKAGYHHDRCIRELQKYERAYNEAVGGAQNPTRRGKPEYTNTLRLCSATLVIVPPNLMIQWQAEIKRHIDEDALSLCVIHAPGDPVPSWNVLATCDIVLISKSRFEQEYRDDDLNQGKGIRYAEKYKSPLTEVRWLRVICDEGHGFAGSSTKTNAMAMLDKMYIERRWVVSGTPSGTLHGVEVGLASIESVETDTGALSLKRRASIGSTLKARRAPDTQEAEAKDLERLRLIVINFLKLQPWANKKGDDQADWRTYLAPRQDIHGHRHSMPALREVMQTLIVRHRIQDLDCDLVLPTLHNKVVYLDPSYYDKLSINLFIMVLISNYVTSERQDEDYMFHPRNRGKLTTLVNNLGHASFYWVGFTPQNVQDTLDVSAKYLDAHIDKVSDRDGMLLTEAIENGNRALADPGWKAFSTIHEMGIYASDFPIHARVAWALDGMSETPLLLGTTQARKVQDHVKNRLAAGSSDIIGGLRTLGIRTMDIARNDASERETLRVKQKIGTDQKEVGVTEGPSKRAPTTTLSPGKAGNRAAVNGSTQVDAGIIPNTSILGFASSKLAYLCSALLSHPGEKSIIFYTNNNTAFFVAEALELIRIPFLIYANTLSVQKRAEYLATFNTDAETKVLLMDLKQAGQGLHVAAASRVYIISPIWDPAVESQAIKRAHRIGQTREVFVEILVLKGTFEEALVKRKKQKTERSSGKDSMISNPAQEPNEDVNIPMKKGNSNHSPLLDDSVMVKILKDIRFLRFAEEPVEKFARLSKPVPLFSAPASSPDLTTVADVPMQTSDATEGPSRITEDRAAKPSIFGLRDWQTSSLSKRKNQGLIDPNASRTLPSTSTKRARMDN